MPSARPERLQLLAQAAELLENGTDYEKTLDCVARLLVSSLASWCTIDLVNQEGGVERVAVAHRDVRKDELTKLMLRRYLASPNAKNGVYRVIETREAILRPVLTREDWARRADDPRHLDMIMELGSTSYMCVPLVARARVVGAFILFSDLRTYDEDDLETALELARLIAMAVDNVSMFRKMKATLDELESTHHQLVQSSKLAAIGLISAGIAHEINNPLTVIRCYLTRLESMFERGTPPGRWEFTYFSDKMNRSVDRIVKIVNNVKEFSRRSDRCTEKVDLRAVTETSLALFDEVLKIQRIQVETHWPLARAFVRGDTNRLEQVIVNVISNARDAITSRHQLGGRIIIAVAVLDGGVRITVTDDGHGMTPDQRKRVFEPFYTTKEAGRGTGLGLSISQGIVEDHGGRIEIDSREGYGTTVTMRFPRFRDVAGSQGEF
ncbi:MAG: ATP-binding protein [Bdellovibrionota bacterium]